MLDESNVAPSIYLETTIVSYLTSHPSTHIIVAANQEMTRQWWKEEREKYRCYISPYVIEESELGDSEAAQRRMVILETIPSLDITPQIEQLAERIAKALKIPRLAQMDAFHLACAIEYGLDYLLTWNCTHLANGPRLKMLSSFAATESLWMPIILTPMEMVSEKENNHVC